MFLKETYGMTLSDTCERSNLHANLLPFAPNPFVDLTVSVSIQWQIQGGKGVQMHPPLVASSYKFKFACKPLTAIISFLEAVS